MKGRIATALIAGLLAGCTATTAAPPAETAAPVADAAPSAEPAAEEPAPPEPVAPAQPEPELEAVANAPLRASVHSELSPSYRKVTFLTLQSIVDEVTISATQLNRGNCETYPITSKGNLPVTLRFGESVQVEMKDCGGLLEAIATTNVGDVAFTFTPPPAP